MPRCLDPTTSSCHHVLMPQELTIQRLLQAMTEREASDLHIKVGSPPVLRIAAHLHQLNLPVLSAEDTKKMLMPIVPPHQLTTLENRGGGDFSHTEGLVQSF